ncbi:hypothetical protein Tco_0602278, partial [Tanacetum coccineum]
SISTARHVNTAASKPKVNAASPTKYSYFKAHSPLRRPFNQKLAAKTNNFSKKVYTAKVTKVTTAGPEVVVNTAEGKRENAVKSLACWIWRPTRKDQGIFDSGCSRHITRNKSHLTVYQDIDGGFVAFAGSPKGGKITEKSKIRTGKLDFEDVYFVKELKFNLFSVSQMCDKKNNVLFTETECLILSPDFKLLDESQVLLKVPRQNNIGVGDEEVVVGEGVVVLLHHLVMLTNSCLCKGLMVNLIFWKGLKKSIGGIHEIIALALGWDSGQLHRNLEGRNDDEVGTDATDLTFSINLNRRNDVLDGRRVGLIWDLEGISYDQLNS